MSSFCMNDDIMAGRQYLRIPTPPKGSFFLYGVGPLLPYFVDRRIASIPTPSPETRQLDYWDETPRGFGVRVSASARSCFAIA